jgi:hypothetical protein
MREERGADFLLGVCYSDMAMLYNSKWLALTLTILPLNPLKRT